MKPRWNIWHAGACSWQRTELENSGGSVSAIKLSLGLAIRKRLRRRVQEVMGVYAATVWAWSQEMAIAGAPEWHDGAGSRQLEHFG